MYGVEMDVLWGAELVLLYHGLLEDINNKTSSHHSKCCKILNTLFHTFHFFLQLFLKILSRIANSVDPDQLLPSGVV